MAFPETLVAHGLVSNAAPPHGRWSEDAEQARYGKWEEQVVSTVESSRHDDGRASGDVEEFDKLQNIGARGYARTDSLISLLQNLNGLIAKGTTPTTSG